MIDLIIFNAMHRYIPQFRIVINNNAVRQTLVDERLSPATRSGLKTRQIPRYLEEQGDYVPRNHYVKLLYRQRVSKFANFTPPP